MTALRSLASLPGVVPDLLAAMGAWDQAAWSLAALAVVASSDGPSEINDASLELLRSRQITLPPWQAADSMIASQVASQAAAPLHQAAALASGRAYNWSDESDQALLAQGRASAIGARALAELILPAMGDLGNRLAAPAPRMLDVGTGVGALAIAFAQVFPQLHVLGIDVLGRSLDLARQAIAASDVADRVTVRMQDVADLTDEAGFDLAFLPAPFIPRSALEAGIRQVAATLRPGGWVFMARGRFGVSPVEDALTRLKTLVYGGTPLGESEASDLLRSAGLTSVTPISMPDGAPGITIGRAGPAHFEAVRPETPRAAG